MSFPFVPHRLRRLLARAFPAAILLVIAAGLLKGRPIDHSRIAPELLRAPRQEATTRDAFSFVYKRRECRVRPVAEYELWGLVVSHNNIESVADIYHDSSSVDTKDLCVLWGDNLASNDFHRVEFRSGSWTCYFSYPDGVAFRHDGLGNNHLITDQPSMRDRIAGVRVGDQVRLKGFLADYQMDDWGSFWRQTSTVHTDSDCEVVFVEELEILARGSPGAYLAYRLGWIFVALIPVAYLALTWLEAGDPASSRIGEI